MIERIEGLILDPEAADFVVRALEMLADYHRSRGAMPTAKLVEVTEQLRSGANTGVTRRSPGAGNRFVVDEHGALQAPWHAFIDSRRAADILGITPNGARDLARRGTLPARRSGREWIFDAAAVIRRAESSSR